MSLQLVGGAKMCLYLTRSHDYPCCLCNIYTMHTVKSVNRSRIFKVM